VDHVFAREKEAIGLDFAVWRFWRFWREVSDSSRCQEKEKTDVYFSGTRQKKKLLTIKLPLEKPRPSASGKTMLIASTRGLKSGDGTYSGHPVAVVANAFFYAEPRQSGKRKSKLAESITEENAEEES